MCVQAGLLVVATYAAGVFLFNKAANLSYTGPIIALLFVNALVARFTDGTVIYVVPTPSKPKSGGGDAAKKD